MYDVPVFYATTEGQTRRIAEPIAAILRDHGLNSAAIDVASKEAKELTWSHIRGAILGASLHGHRHQATAAAFARTHRDSLNGHVSGFFSVSLSAASKNRDEVEATKRIAADFLQDVGWQPTHTVCLAGRLAYTHYGFFKRLIMRRIAKAEGASTDTSRDYEYTDWPTVDRFALEMTRNILASEVESNTREAVR